MRFDPMQFFEKLENYNRNTIFCCLFRDTIFVSVLFSCAISTVIFGGAGAGGRYVFSEFQRSNARWEKSFIKKFDSCSSNDCIFVFTRVMFGVVPIFPHNCCIGIFISMSVARDEPWESVIVNLKKILIEILALKRKGKRQNKLDNEYWS